MVATKANLGQRKISCWRTCTGVEEHLLFPRRSLKIVVIMGINPLMQVGALRVPRTRPTLLARYLGSSSALQGVPKAVKPLPEAQQLGKLHGLVAMALGKHQEAAAGMEV
jgi:hypothetical protein